jgi:sulfoxide reductase catalytic subunit YedY
MRGSLPGLADREVTPETIWLRRRELLSSASRLALGAFPLAAGACVTRRSGALADLHPAPRAKRFADARDLTPEALASAYNNFAEFGASKRIAWRTRGLRLSPWTVEIGGLARRTGRFDVETLVRRFPLEERVYRLRCVEAWSIVVPWTGFPLRALLSWAEPSPSARYVRFQSFHRPRQAIGQLLSPGSPWPYSEGLRLDEAAHELTLLATGIYGRPLPAQHGAPLRLVVPWKYGFKSIKSIERIEFVRERPATFWNTLQPEEYGFVANVDPYVSHPRWSQATERRLGREERYRTELYNGYAAEVAQLYAP